ncbi:MAG: hypothetical protein K2N03_02785 [Muribaculaceae bacterium]|nr:hypothetical protein [Muribaculaceae bacterium]
MKMLFRLAGLVLLFLTGVLSTSCVSENERQKGEEEANVIAEPDLTAEAAAWADSVTGSLTLQKRIGQLFMPAVYSVGDSQNMALIADYVERLGVGGLVLLKGKAASASEIADTLDVIAPLGLFMAIDAENGLSMRFEDAPKFPWNSEISPDVNEVVMFDYGREMARECSIAGINMILGPVMDVTPTGKEYLRGANRSFGGDAERVGRLGTAYSRGLESGGVMSVAKHFPGHGAAATDSHKGLAVVDRSREELLKTDLLPFRAYVNGGLSGVMVGHIYAPALDGIERPASFSPVIMDSLLRRQMKFKGLILTDALNMKGARGFTAADALGSGADMVLAPLHTEDAMVEVRDAVERGELSEETISDRCRRVLFYKYLRGIVGRKPAGRVPWNEKALHTGADTIRVLLRRGLKD